jgi:hypothetical protein
MFLIDLPFFHEKKHDQEKYEAGQDMETMQPGHGIVKAVEKDFSSATL